MDIIKDLLKVADVDSHKLAREMIRSIIREAKINGNDEVIRDLLIITKPYQEKGNRIQQQSFHIVWEAAKRRKKI